MTEQDALRAELAATKRALRIALAGINGMLAGGSTGQQALYKLREAIKEAEVWND